MPIMRSLHHLSHKPNFDIKAARQYTTQSYTSEGRTRWFHRRFGIGHLTLISDFENLSANHLPSFTKIQQQFSHVPHAFLYSPKAHGAALKAWRPVCQLCHLVFMYLFSLIKRPSDSLSHITFELVPPCIVFAALYLYGLAVEPSRWCTAFQEGCSINGESLQEVQEGAQWSTKAWLQSINWKTA